MPSPGQGRSTATPSRRASRLPPEPRSPEPSSSVRAARRLLRRSGRQRARRFLAEGPQAVREALACTDRVDEVFATPDAARRYADLKQLGAARGAIWRVVDEPALATLSETVTPQGLVAVCRLPETELSAVAQPGPSLVAVCAAVRDPGNAGTVIRCADAAGAAGVVFAGDCVDPFNGKAVRASAGSLFHLPVVVDVPIGAVVTTLRSAGLHVVAADGSGGLTLDQAQDEGVLARPTAWVFGNEAWGLPKADLALCDQVVRVPIYGRAESLNLATAAALCLYASARAQRAE